MLNLLDFSKAMFIAAATMITLLGHNASNARPVPSDLVVKGYDLRGIDWEIFRPLRRYNPNAPDAIAPAGFASSTADAIVNKPTQPDASDDGGTGSKKEDQMSPSEADAIVDEPTQPDASDNGGTRSTKEYQTAQTKSEEAHRDAVANIKNKPERVAWLKDVAKLANLNVET